MEKGKMYISVPSHTSVEYLSVFFADYSAHSQVIQSLLINIKVLQSQVSLWVSENLTFRLFY